MKDKFISDLSYTNKDFNTIYPELLDLVKKLTNKWDPSLSNESDPGVLLLKLNAIIADKNNYNIDKNILECFPLSVTQEGNARRLYDMLGYNMHWYRSATTDISFQLRNLEDISSAGYIIKQFTTIMDATGESVFTILSDVPLSSSALTEPVTVPAIEGIVSDYMINDSRLITVANLDNNLRLYFQEKMVAENGIFIADAPSATVNPDNLTFSTEYSDELRVWKRVDNLASYPLGEKIYEFGVLPNSNTCYIEFPQDIASLIEHGIFLKYTITKGVQGNIKSNILNLFYENQESNDKVINESIRIIQPYSTSNGEDPETLDDAYRNYKKTIGTFNTLVTERDYENFIYNLKSKGKPMVSNVNVSDRTDDINYSNYVQVWAPFGSKKELLPVKDYSGKETLNAYNIVLYLLNQPLSVYDKATYNSSFKPCTDEVVQESIKAHLSDTQSVQHDVVVLTDTTEEGDVLKNDNLVQGFKKFSIENMIALTGSLITYNKVSKMEALDIEKNVLSTLYKKYNSRNVTFGEEISYDELVETIQQADSRIKTVVLNIPTYRPSYNLVTNSTSIYGNTTAFDPYIYVDDNSQDKRGILNHELLAKMILAGNVQLFKFDTDFEYEFGQSNSDAIKSDANSDINIIKAITSETVIELNDSDNKLIRENEVVQIIEPSLVTTTEYSTYVRYYLDVEDVPDLPVNYEIKAGQNHKLKCPLLLRYKEGSSGIYKEQVLEKGTIINSSISISRLATQSKAEYTTWKALAAGETISVKELNQSHLLPNTKCYFITNDTDNRLVIDVDTPKILQENEYFIYTNENSNELIMLGSGTELSIPNGAERFDERIERVDIEKITSDEIDKIDWLKLSQDLFITELKITNVGKGCEIKLGYDSSLQSPPENWESSIEVNNRAQPLHKDAIITITDENGDTSEIHPCQLDNGVNLIQSRLYINATQYEPQVLKEGQSFTFSLISLDELGDPVVDALGNIVIQAVITLRGTSEGKAIVFNNPLILSGGINVDVKVLDDYGQYKYSLRAMEYVKTGFSSNVTRSSSIPGQVGTPSITTIARNKDDVIILNRNSLIPITNTVVVTDENGEPLVDEDGNTITTDITVYEGSVDFNFTFNEFVDDNGYVHEEDGYLIPIYVTITNKEDGENKAKIEIPDFKVFGEKLTYKPIDGGKVEIDEDLKDAIFYISENNADTKANGITIINSRRNESNISYPYLNRAFIIRPSALGKTNLQIKISNFGENDSITIGKIFKLDGYNKQEIDVEDLNHTYEIDIDAEKVKDQMRFILPDATSFNWVYEVPDIDKVLYPTSADSYWNVNHIYNKYTLPKIDFDNTKIKINPATLVQ